MTLVRGRIVTGGPLHEVRVRVPAKINLALSVGGVRSDGNHDLVTVFHAVGLWDEVVATAADSLSISITGITHGVPVSNENLAARAAIALARRAKVACHVKLTVHKQIPVAAGLAGGSADAAGALVACAALWNLGLDRADLIPVAATLGADVPFALHGGTVIGTGTGTALTPVLASGDFNWVLGVARSGLSTPAVYAELDRLRGPRLVAPAAIPPAVLAALRSGNAVALGAALSNDLQRAALSLRPALGMALEVGRDYGSLGALVSGSGPTIALLARDEEHALDLASALASSGTCQAVLRAAGPVPGARVVIAA